MAIMKVNPTRMELRRLKTRLKTATRGHKLLKDKSDEMIRRFMEYVKLNKSLREEVESELVVALKGFTVAKSLVDTTTLDTALSVPGVKFGVDVTTRNILSVEVPVLSVKKEGIENYPYSFASVPSAMDTSIGTVTGLLGKLLKLAEVEKTCNMLADEIEKNRRRVNALEYVMIPQLQETIKYITMKLDENERGNLIRLMKVKSMIDNR